jgi:hypothetical protein
VYSPSECTAVSDANAMRLMSALLCQLFCIISGLFHCTSAINKHPLFCNCLCPQVAVDRILGLGRDAYAGLKVWSQVYGREMLAFMLHCHLSTFGRGSVLTGLHLGSAVHNHCL